MESSTIHFPFIYGMDFGVNDRYIGKSCSPDKKNALIYVSEEPLSNDMSTDTLFELIKSRGVGRSLIVADSAPIELYYDPFLTKVMNIVACSKRKITEDIKAIKSYTIIINRKQLTTLLQN